MFSAILLSFGRGSGWDELLYVITELPASFLRPVPRFDPLCVGACNVRPPLGITIYSCRLFSSYLTLECDLQMWPEMWPRNVHTVPGCLLVHLLQSWWEGVVKNVADHDIRVIAKLFQALLNNTQRSRITGPTPTWFPSYFHEPFPKGSYTILCLFLSNDIFR